MTCLKDRVLGGAGKKSHVGEVFCIYLGTMYANFQEKILAEISGKKFHCSTVITMKSLELFPRNLCKHFFLKIGIHSAKVYTKNVPNIEVCDFIPSPSRTSPIKQVIVVLYLQGGYIYVAMCTCTDSTTYGLALRFIILKADFVGGGNYIVITRNMYCQCIC